MADDTVRLGFVQPAGRGHRELLRSADEKVAPSYGRGPARDRLDALEVVARESAGTNRAGISGQIQLLLRRR